MNCDEAIEISTPLENFSYCHRLPFHKGHCKRLHGHTGFVKVNVYGTIDKETNFVIDFGVLKEIVRNIVNKCDHKTLIGTKEAAKFEDKLGVNVYEYSDGFIIEDNMDSVLWIEGNSTAECISEVILKEVMDKLKGYSNLLKAEVEFGEGPKNTIKRMKRF